MRVGNGAEPLQRFETGLLQRRGKLVPGDEQPPIACRRRCLRRGVVARESREELACHGLGTARPEAQAEAIGQRDQQDAAAAEAASGVDESLVETGAGGAGKVQRQQPRPHDLHLPPGECLAGGGHGIEQHVETLGVPGRCLRGRLRLPDGEPVEAKRAKQ